MTKRRPWLIPLIVLASLLLAMALRWNVEASRVLDTGVVKWEKDRWTGRVWMTPYIVPKDLYTVSILASAPPEGGQNYAKRERDGLTVGWIIVTGSVGVWLIVALRKTLN